MRKISLFLIMLLAVFAPWAARAQNSVTLYDGATSTNYYVPMYTYYCDYGFKSEYIIPATALQAKGLADGYTLTSITFTQSSGSTWEAKDLTIKLTNTTTSSYSSSGLLGSNGVTVKTISYYSANSATTHTFEFSEAFEYTGGSLIVQVSSVSGGEDVSSNWKGESTTTNQGYYVYGSGSSSGSLQKFIPQTTFTYQLPSSCTKPESLVATTSGNSATFTWSGGSGTYNVEYKKSSDADWTPVLSNTALTTTTVSPLDPDTEYEVHVQSVCSGNEVSSWKSTSFHTDCGVVATFPKTYGFETSEGFPANASNLETNAFSDCWRNEATVKTGSYSARLWGTSTSNYKNGSQSLQLPDKGNGCRTMLVFPVMNFTSTNGYVVSFWIYRDGTNSNPEGFKVYASDTDTISANAVELGHYSRNYAQPYPKAESSSGWYQYETAPITMTGNVYLIFEGHSYYGQATYVDDVRIDVAPPCAKPSGLTADQITSTTASLSWTPGSTTQDHWDIYYSTQSTEPTDATQPTITNTNRNPYPLTDLTATTSYYVWVRGNCGDEVSDWSYVYTFMTECPANYPLDYTCGFEGPNTTGSNPMPMCWTRMGSHTDYPKVSTSQHHGEGSRSLYFYKSSSSTYNNEIAALPAIDAEMNTVRVVFYGKFTNTSSDPTINVGYVTSLTDASSFQSVQTVTLTTSWEKYTVSFGNVGNVTGNIAFQALYSTNYAYIYIDDVLVEEIPSCLEPVLGEPDLTATTATLHWTQEGSVSSWNIRWRENGSTGEYQTATSSTTSYQITTGLSGNKTYEYGVQAGCGSNWSEGTFTTACPEFAEVPFTQNFDGIPGSTSNSANNLPQCWDYINASTSSYNQNYPIVYSGANYNSPNSLKFYIYQYYSGYNPQPQYAILPAVQNLSGLRMRLYARAYSTSSSYNNTFKVGVMVGTDASTFETIETITPTSTTYKEYIIPFDNYTGEGTRIAILVEVPSSTYDYAGVYIDNITVEQIPDCATPTDLAYSNTTPEGATITWAAGEGNEWTVQYKKTADTEWTTVTPNVTEPTHTFTGLDFSTSYQARVSVVCTEGTGITYPTNPVSFTTKEQFPAPTNLVVSNLTINSATLSWTPGYTNQTAWKVQYKKSSDSWTDAATIVSTPTLDIREGLEENTTYNVRIYGGIDETFGTSSLTSSFTTKDSQGAPTDLVVSVTPNSATLSWTPGYTTQDHWTVKYKKNSVSSWDDATTEDVTEPTITLDELDGLTKYDVQIYYVEANKLTGSFTTAGAFPYTEDFTNVSDFANLVGWNRYTGQLDETHGTATLSSSTSSWKYSNSMNFNEPHIYSNVYYTNCYKWAVSPTLYCSAEAFVKFDLALTKYDNASGQPAAVDPTQQQDDKFIVLITKDNGATWTQLAKWDNAGSERVYNNIATLWENVTLNINESYAGEYIRIAFYGESTVSGGDNNVHIDNVEIDIVQDCDKPVLTLGDYAATTADFSWSAGESSTTWTLNYKKTSDEEWTVVPDIATNHYQIPDLTPEQAYEVRVMASCNIYWSNTVTFTTTATCPGAVDLAVTENSETAEGATIAWTFAADSYKVFYGEPEEVTLFNYDFENGTIPATFTNDTYLPWTVTTNDQHAGTYSIKSGGDDDYDSDLTLEVTLANAGTLTFWARISSEEGYDEGYFYIDNTVQSGLNGISGETEWTKYTYALTAGTHSLVWSYSKDYYGGSEGDDCFYVDDIVITGSAVNTWNLYGTATESPYLINGLEAETTYQVKLQSVCGAEEGEDSNIVEFTTIEACSTPTQFELGEVGSHSASFSWNAGNAPEWKVWVKKSSETDYPTEYTTVNTPSATINNLDAATTYDVKITSACDETKTLEVLDAFTTDCDIISDFPWKEDFEGFEASTVPMCWDNTESTAAEISSSPHYIWGVYNYNDNNMIRMYNYYTHSGTALINTPSITVPDNGTYYLTFDYSHRANCSALKVKVSDDNGVTFDELGTYNRDDQISTSSTYPGTFTPVMISLDDYAGKTIIVQFYSEANYGSGAIFVDNVAVKNAQKVTLTAGWNWFSTYVTVDDPVELLDMFKEGLGDNAEEIQSYDYTTEYEGDGEWFGDLDEEGLENEQMYMIKVVNACTFLLEGEPVDTEEYEITIKPGWNWIGFPSNVALDVNEALSEFEAEEGDEIQSKNFTTEYDGEEWFGDLEEFQPGDGLKYFSNSIETKTMTFVISTKKRQ